MALDAPNQGLAQLQSNRNLCAVQILLGHTDIENTDRYLGVDTDNAITFAERTEIRRRQLLAIAWSRRRSG